MLNVETADTQEFNKAQFTADNFLDLMRATTALAPIVPPYQYDGT